MLLCARDEMRLGMAASQILSVCIPALVIHKQANIHENAWETFIMCIRYTYVAVTVSFNKYGSTNTLKNLGKLYLHKLLKFYCISKKFRKQVYKIFELAYKLHPAFHLKVYF